MKTKPIIMTGGNGKRLWPLSCNKKPKQFKKILGESTLLQQTLNRNRFLGKATVITVEKYEVTTKKQASDIDIEIELILNLRKKIPLYVQLLQLYWPKSKEWIK